MIYFKTFFFVFVLLIFFSKIILAQESKVRNHQIYFQHDNDVFRLVEQSDQYYSFGLLTGYAQVLSDSSWLYHVLDFLPGLQKEKRLFTLDYSLKGYTPEFEKDTVSGPKRPFAGVSVFQAGIQSSNSKRMLTMGLTMGVRGPASGAETVQDNFHRLIQDEVFEGWATQLPNKFLYGIRSTYAYSFKLTSWADMASVTELAIGNYQTHLDQRLTLRIGKIRPINQSLLFRNHLGESYRKPEFYLSATLIGRLIGVDTTFGKLDDQQRDESVVNKSNLLAGYSVSGHFQSNRVGLYIAHKRISSESNFSTKHSYGSLGISYSF